MTKEDKGDHINYIIASYAGKTEKRLVNPMAEYFLDIQLNILDRIFKLKKEKGVPNLVKQITIVCPTVTRHEYFPLYYQFPKWEEMMSKHEVALVRHDLVGGNSCYSYDQYIQAMLAFPEFKYSILNEDDWVIARDYWTFDVDLVELYKKHCPEGKGFLSTLCSGPNEWIPIKHSAISNGILSTKTITDIENVLGKFYDIPLFSQIAFSVLFSMHNLPIPDLGQDYRVMFYEEDKQLLIEYTENADTFLFIPIQYLYHTLPVLKRRMK